MQPHPSLTLGILETGPVAPTLLAEHGSYPEMFKTLLSEQDKQLQFRVYDVITGQYPQQIDECDAYLLTGSKYSAFDELPWIATLKDYIRLLAANKKKQVGICFGHQIIAQALGGEVKKSERGWGVGIHHASLVAGIEQPWLKGDKAGFNLLVSHQDQVTALPEAATLLATSEFCPNAAFYIPTVTLCFQGHPEFTPAYAKALMASRRQSIGQDTCEHALASFARSIDHQRVAAWILNFIQPETL